MQPDKDIPAHIANLMKKIIMAEIEEAIRNSDSSNLNKEHARKMFKSISRCEFELDILLTLTEEIGGFCSSYPQRCLELLKTFSAILELEEE